MSVIKWLQTYRQSVIFAVLVIGVCVCMFVSKSFMTIAFGICIFLYAISVLEKSFASFTIIENFLKKMELLRKLGKNEEIDLIYKDMANKGNI